MTCKGFVFSLEAVLSLILLSSLILTQLPAQEKDLHGLLVFQKENDLLKIWAKQQKFSLEEMKKDALFGFPNTSFEIFVNGEKISVGKKTGKAIASQIAFFGSDLEKIEISIKVFE